MSRILLLLIAAFAAALAMEKPSHGEMQGSHYGKHKLGQDLDIIHQQGQFMESMNKKLDGLTETVNIQGQQIVVMEKDMTEMRKELRNTEQERKLLHETIKNQGKKVESMEKELREQAEIVKNLEGEVDACTMKLLTIDLNENELVIKDDVPEDVASQMMVNQTVKKVDSGVVRGEETAHRKLDSNALWSSVLKKERKISVQKRKVACKVKSESNAVKRLLLQVSGTVRPVTRTVKISTLPTKISTLPAKRTTLPAKRTTLPVTSTTLPVKHTGIAFSAYLSHAIDHMSIGHNIKLDKIVLNDGNGYNTHTGVFTVPESGVYLLTFTIDSYYVNNPVEVELLVDDISYGSAAAVGKGSDHTVLAGKTIIARLTTGQSVWLQTIYYSDEDIISSGINRFTTFSGVFLY